jgi:hypothetical protein
MVYSAVDARWGRSVQQGCAAGRPAYRQMMPPPSGGGAAAAAQKSEAPLSSARCEVQEAGTRHSPLLLKSFVLLASTTLFSASCPAAAAVTLLPSAP